MTTVEDTVTDEEVKNVERAEITSEREKTKYGGGIPEGHREDSDEL